MLSAAAVLEKGRKKFGGGGLVIWGFGFFFLEQCINSVICNAILFIRKKKANNKLVLSYFTKQGYLYLDILKYG